LFKRIASMLTLGAVTLAPASPSSVVQDDERACDTVVVEYVLGANLLVKQTTMGAGDGVYKVGPGRLVLRFENHGGQETVKLVAYELRQKFVVASRAVFWGARVATDIVTRGPPGGRPIAEGTLDRSSVHWDGPPRGLHSDGTLTCDGALCGKFGAPAPGTSEMHMALDAAELEPFTLGADGKTFTMPYSLMSKSDSPKQETLVAITGRELRRACLAFR
jgi:hypothetical protein